MNYQQSLRRLQALSQHIFGYFSKRNNLNQLKKIVAISVATYIFTNVNLNQAQYAFYNIFLSFVYFNVETICNVFWLA